MSSARGVHNSAMLQRHFKLALCLWLTWAEGPARVAAESPAALHARPSPPAPPPPEPTPAPTPHKHHPGDEAPNLLPFSAEWWIHVVACSMLALFAAIMSGLTLAFMSVDSINLSVILSCGTDLERLYADAMKPLLRDRHLLLVTLLLGNAVAAETLPIVLDRILPARMAILVSVTVLLIFSEIIPQALCSKHKLVVGGLMARFVSFLMSAAPCALLCLFACVVAVGMEGGRGDCHAMII